MTTNLSYWPFCYVETVNGRTSEPLPARGRLLVTCLVSARTLTGGTTSSASSMTMAAPSCPIRKATPPAHLASCVTIQECTGRRLHGAPPDFCEHLVAHSPPRRPDRGGLELLRAHLLCPGRPGALCSLSHRESSCPPLHSRAAAPGRPLGVAGAQSSHTRSLEQREQVVVPAGPLSPSRASSARVRPVVGGREVSRGSLSVFALFLYQLCNEAPALLREARYPLTPGCRGSARASSMPWGASGAQT
jgi:hypothetical protein